MTEIPFARPWFGEEEVDAVAETIRSGWVMQGPRVREFEETFAAYTGAAHACAVSSCTAALHLALRAVGVVPGDVVITVSHSFIASANAVRACFAEPVFVDVEPDTLNMDPQALGRCLAEDFETRDDGLWFRQVDRLSRGDSPLRRCAGEKGRLGAIVVIHQAGTPADLSGILALAREHGIPLVEDGACALGSEITLDGGTTWDRIGRPHGDVACFSFHPRKIITTGEGGMLTTNDTEMDRRLRLDREHGMTVSTAERENDRQMKEEYYVTAGFNYRLTDLQAAVGVVQMGRLAEILKRRRRIGGWYETALSGIDGIRPPTEPSYARVNFQSYVARLDDASRQLGIMQALKDRGVNTRHGITCSHREQPYADLWPAGCLPNSERARADGLILPFHPNMSEEDVHTVASELRQALAG